MMTLKMKRMIIKKAVTIPAVTTTLTPTVKGKR
jgi:hypothetical protein